MQIPMKPSRFMELGREITHRAGNHRAFSTEYRRFRAFFGVSPSTCALLWGRIRTQGMAPRARAVHLLWGLLFLNLYDPEEVIAGFLGVDEQTYREWSYEMVVAIARLKPLVVCFFTVFCSCLRSISLHFSHSSLFLPLFIGLVCYCRSCGPIDTEVTSAGKPKCLLMARTSSYHCSIQRSASIPTSSKPPATGTRLPFASKLATLSGSMVHFRVAPILTSPSFVLA